MARRQIAPEPMSRLAIWSLRCAIFSLVATGLVILIVRKDWMEVNPSIATITGALGFAALAILLAVGALVVIWRNGNQGLGRAMLAIFVGAGLLAYPAYAASKYLRTPELNDITTDIRDPPRFDEVTRRGFRPKIEYAGAVVAARQQRAYSDIEPLTVSAAPQLAYEAAISVVSKRKWSVILSRAPQAGRRDGQIEAVARTPILGFREDVVVRVRGSPEGARIDIRSASRYGSHDLGSNATRVRSLLEDIDDQVSTMLEEQKRRMAKPTPAKPAPQPAKR